MTRPEFAFSLFMLVLIGGMTVLALSYPAETRLAPAIIGIPATIFCIANALHAWKRLAAGQASDRGRVPLRREARAVLWFLGFVLGIVLFGFYIGAPALIFLYYWLGQRTRLVSAFLAAALMWLIVYGVFTIGLQQILFNGILFDKLA